jgi:TetR/AcrR family transcriptional regulator, regulator of cefoperazone and chloramphenicol sensitivity
MKKKTPPRILPAPADTRDKLLRAAIQVFSEHGYERATVREISRVAGTNLALVKYHFGDKLELFREVVRYATDADAKMAVLTQALRENTDPSEALRQIIRGVLERLSARREQTGLQLRLMLNEIANPSMVLTGEIECAIRPIYDLFRELVGQILGLPMDDTKTRLCTHSISGQIAHYVHARPILSRLWPEMQMTPEQFEMIATHIADFSLAYLEAKRAETPVRSAKTVQKKSPRKRT